ncbi:MAG: hypothetical protein Kow0080_10410 [Candidatus Promineifilaceae bacterium]
MENLPMSGPRLRSLLRQAKQVADAGKKAAAAQLYNDILAEVSDSVEAWVGLGDVLLDVEEAEAAYLKALALDPDNEAAAAGLARLHGDAPAETAVPNSPANDDPFTQSQAWLESVTAPDKPSAAPAADKKDGYKLETAVSQPQTVEETTLACYRHPNRETSLRCYSCNKPICSSCAILTPVGYRCPTCVREAEDAFYSATALDYILAPLVVFPASVLAGYLAFQIGGGLIFLLLVLFAGGAVGNVLGRLALRATGKRRGRYLPHLTAVSIMLGVGLSFFLALMFGGIAGFFGPVILAVIMASSAFSWLK